MGQKIAHAHGTSGIQAFIPPNVAKADGVVDPRRPRVRL
jgi:hypothetical protein